MRTFEAYLRDVANSCNTVLYSGYRNNYSDVIKAATEMYVAELQTESLKERGCINDDVIQEVVWFQNWENITAIVDDMNKHIEKGWRVHTCLEKCAEVIVVYEKNN